MSVCRWKLGAGVAALGLLPAAVVLFWALAARAADPPPAAEAAGIQFARNKIQPLLEARCFECHSGRAKELKGGLRLDSRQAILKGGESGAVVTPGRPDKSVLIDAINYRGDHEMPPKSKMPDGEIALLTHWVEMGAPWPEGAAASAAPAPAQDKVFPLAERKASHWAWRPIANPPVPRVKQQDWPRDDLDRFVLAGLEAARLKPAPPADRRTLARRVWFDLIGLPPTPQQINDFVADPAPTDQALDKAVDSLLASGHFGERWGRHWLDLVRYAEGRGHEYDFTIPNAWQYRDYVVRALNADVPYNEFVTEQIAGDLLPKPRLNPEQGFNESILGTGFWYLGDWVHAPVDIRRDETDRIDNMIDTLGRGFLGLTLGCARCHDHKFDAISTRDYYALAGFIRSSDYCQVPFDTLEHNRRVAQELWDVRRKAAPQLRQLVAESLRPAVGRAAEYLQGAMAAVRQQQGAAEIAEERHLDRERLDAWVQQLRAAAQAKDDPLFLFARLAAAHKAAAATGAGTTVAAWLERADRAAKQPKNDAKPPQVLVDFAHLGPNDWLQQGFAFGSAPVRPGDLGLGPDPLHPIGGVELYGAARWDPLWGGLQLAPDTEMDYGALGKMHRPGQTLRSPSFTIPRGQLYYLLWGKGMLQAVVASHRMVRAPLHADVIQKFDTHGKFQWVSHPLEKFRGLRAHIEFVPSGDGPFEVLKIVDSPARPRLPSAPGSGLLRERLGEISVAETPRLAAAWQQLLLDTLDELATGTIADGAHADDEAWLANWIVQHPGLFESGDKQRQNRIAAVVKRLRRDETRLGAEIQKTSHTAVAIADGSGEDEQLLIRGNSSTPAGPVPRRFLEALAGPEPLKTPRGSGRLELARQMVDPAVDPLLARVIVNRVWYHLIGRGIVASVDNFGALGQKPSNPELLDHLASQFIADGWSIKKLIRRIITSRTYQMSSRPADPAAEAADPDNVLPHRMNLRRLEAEAIRDSILAVSGRLDPKIGGPPVPVHLTEFMTGRGRPESGPLDGDGRRSIYTSVRRNFLSPMMLAFDMPFPAGPVGRRNVSNVPAQPLILLNDPFVVQQTRVWADKVLADKSATPQRRIQRMYLSALGRDPEPEELSDALKFLHEQAADYGAAGDGWQRDPRVWADFGHVLWNVKEFIFID